MTFSLLDKVDGDGKGALMCLSCFDCGNYHWKSHLGFHQKKKKNADLQGSDNDIFTVLYLRYKFSDSI